MRTTKIRSKRFPCPKGGQTKRLCSQWHRVFVSSVIWLTRVSDKPACVSTSLIILPFCTSDFKYGTNELWSSAYYVLDFRNRLKGWSELNTQIMISFTEFVRLLSSSLGLPYCFLVLSKCLWCWFWLIFTYCLVCRIGISLMVLFRTVLFDE